MKVILGYFSIYADVIPAILFLFAVKKHQDKGLWGLFFLNLYSFFTNILLGFWSESLHISEYLIYRVFTVVSYSFIAYFFYKNLVTTFARRAVVISYILFLGYALYDYIRSPQASFDSVPTAIEATLIIVFSIFFLFEQIKTPRVFFIYMLDKFWIITSFLIYYTGTFFLFIFAETYLADPGFGENYSLINNLFLLLKNIFFSIGLLISNKPGDDYSSNSYPPFENYQEKRI